MKRILFLLVIIMCFTLAAFSQEVITTTGSNTNISSYGNSMNQYDYLLNPAYIDQMEARTLFFALDNSGQQFGSDNPHLIQGLRAGWAMSDTLGFMMDYKTSTNIDISEVGGEDTEKTEDDFQNIELTYDTYNQATGRYDFIYEDVNDNIKNTTHDHDLLAHSIFSLGDGIAGAAQLLFSLHTHDTHNVDYTNTYSNTAAPTDTSLTDKDDRVEIVNKLLDDNENDIALDLEFGMNTENLITKASLGVSANNLRIGNTYKETITDYNAGTGVDDTVRDSEYTEEWSGQYYYNGARQASFEMDNSAPSYLSTIGTGIGSVTQLPMDDFTLIVPFDVGFDFPMGTLQTVNSKTDIYYNDAAEANTETGREVTSTITTLKPRLYMYAKAGGGVRKVFKPADNATVTAVPSLEVSLDIKNDTRTQTRTTATQSDNNGNGSYADAGDTDTLYTESGWEVKNNSYTTAIELTLPVSAEWKANKLMTFRAGYFMQATFTMTSLSSLETGNNSLIYEQFTDNLNADNSFILRQKDGFDNYSEPDTSFSGDFGFNSGGEFGAELKISDNFSIDILATGDSIQINDFTVMGIMKY